MNLRLRIHLAGDGGEEFFGAGLERLLRGVERVGSIQGAAKEMDLSYVKALKILRRLEGHLGVSLLKRSKGGAAHGGAELTAAGREFLRAYDELRAKICAAGAEAFAEFEAAWEAASASAGRADGE